MGRPFYPPLRQPKQTGEQFGSLEGVSRFYSRIPGGVNKLTTNPTNFVIPVGNTDHVTVIDKVILYVTQGTGAGGIDYRQVTLRQTDGVTPLDLPFLSSDQGSGAVLVNGKRRYVWDTGGTFVLPQVPYGIQMFVDNTDCECIPLITGYRMSSSMARSLGLQNMQTRGLRPSSTGNTAIFAPQAGVSMRIKNIYCTRVAGDGATNHNLRLRFGDGTNFHDIIRFYTKQPHQQFSEPVSLTNLNITGPPGYGLYGTLQPAAAIQPLSVIVTVEFVREHETMVSPGSGTTTGSITASTGPNRYTLGAGSWTRVPPVGSTVSVSGFANAPNNGLHYVIAATSNTFDVAETLTAEAGTGDEVVVVGDIPTGVFPGGWANGPELFGKYFWAHLGGEGSRYLTKQNSFGEFNTQFLIDGCYMDMIPDGAAATGYMGLHAGTPGVPPTINILPAFTIFNAATAEQHHVTYDDLGGLPSTAMSLHQIDYGPDSSITVWGRTKSFKSATPGSVFGGFYTQISGYTLGDLPV